MNRARAHVQHSSPLRQPAQALHAAVTVTAQLGQAAATSAPGTEAGGCVVHGAVQPAQQTSAPGATTSQCRANAWYLHSDNAAAPVSFSQAALHSLSASGLGRHRQSRQVSPVAPAHTAAEVPVAFAPDTSMPAPAATVQHSGVLQARTPQFVCSRSRARSTNHAAHCAAPGSAVAATPTFTGTKRCRSTASRTASSPWMPAVQSAPPPACQHASYKCAPRRIKPTPVIEAGSGPSAPSSASHAATKRARLATPPALPAPLKRDWQGAAPVTAQAHAVIAGLVRLHDMCLRKCSCHSCPLEVQSAWACYAAWHMHMQVYILLCRGWQSCVTQLRM